MKIACIFPGQGAQKVGMGLEFYTKFAVAKNIFDEADDILDQKLSKIIFEGPIEKLTLTENTQTALMICSIAVLRVLEEKMAKPLSDFCSYVAGHSLGEFTALLASGVLSFSQCLKLLKIRGRAMQQAVPAGQGAMFALLGANIEIAKEIIQEVLQKSPEKNDIAIANDNAPSQQVLSGKADKIEEAIKIAKSKGYKTIKLNVSGPFHCPLMEGARQILQDALVKADFKTPQIPIISNFTGKVMLPENIRNNLLAQLTNTVKWCDSIKNLKNSGVKTILEIGPGKIYTNLNKKIDPSINAIALNSEETINIFIEELLKQTH